MKVFLSYSFSGEDSDLVQGLERLLSSQNILVAKGRRPAGGLLLPEVRQRIDDSDGLIALKTRRDRVGEPDENRWRSSPWIDYEYAHARDQGKQAIALVEHGVETGGPFESYEQIVLDRTDPLEAFLALSETLGFWKERIDIAQESAVAPKVFRLPVEIPAEQDLVAVMMPFDVRFNNVYATLQQAVTESGMRCQRADDIWVNNHIVDDIINLIWRARVVITDLSSKNPNVFYETGIAHTLGREVIQIAQSMEDIPFDLRAIRSQTYLNNGEGLERLKAQVVMRLNYLTSAS
jgi:hypothetical protein